MIMNEKQAVKVKGTVLYTVVSVLMIMTVFIIAASSIAMSANKRAYASYAYNQTQYTAKSVVDSVYKAAQDGDINLAACAGKNIKVTLPDRAMGNVDKVTIEKVGTLSSLGLDYGDYFRDYKSEDIEVFKITATASIVKQNNSVSLYFVNAKANETNPFKYSLISLESASVANHGSTLGGFNNGLVNIDDAIGLQDVYLTNEYISDGVNGINGNANVDGGTFRFSNIDQGLFVTGDMTFTNPSTFISDIGKVIDPLKPNNSYKSLPYIFVNGRINFDQNNDQNIGDADHPILLMADSITNFPGNAYGDIYLYNESSTSNLHLKNSTILYKWLDDIVKKRHSDETPYQGGNFYSKGDLKIGGSNSEFYAQGDIIAKSLNFEGTKDIDISGATVARENFIATPSSANNFYFRNGLYIDPDKASIDHGIRFNNVQYSNNLQTYDEAKEVLHTENYPITWMIGEENNEDGYGYKIDINDFQSQPITFNLVNDFNIPEGAKINSVSINWSGGEENLKYNCHLSLCSKNDEIKNWELENSGTIKQDYWGALTVDSGSECSLFFDELQHRYTDWSQGYENPWAVEPWQYIYIKSITINATWSEMVLETVTTGEKSDINEFIKQVNDFAYFGTDKIGTVFIDNIDQSVKIEMLDLASNPTNNKDYANIIRISVAYYNVTPDSSDVDDEGNEKNIGYTIEKEFNYNTEYVEFLKYMASMPNLFPSSMNKSKVISSNGIVGRNLMKESEKANIIKQGKSSQDLMTEVDFSHKNIYYSVDSDGYGYSAGIYSNEYTPGSGWWGWSPVTWEWSVKYYIGYNDLVITDSCTFIDSFSFSNNRTIIIKPGDKDIWIRLINFSANNMTFLIDDSGTGKVNFFIPKAYDAGNNMTYTKYLRSYNPAQDFNMPSSRLIHLAYSDTGNFSIRDNVKFITKSYMDRLSSGLSIKSNAIDAADKWMIPNVYIYMDTDGSGTFSANSSDHIFTAYIMAPTAIFSDNGTSNETNVTYDGKSYGISKLGYVGATVFGHISNVQNDTVFMFVDPNSGSSPLPVGSSGNGDFTKLYYQSY